MPKTHSIIRTIKSIEKQDKKDRRFKTWSKIWAKEKIINELQELVKDKQSIHPAYLNKHYHKLLVAITGGRYFPNWKFAVMAAGFEPGKFQFRRTTFLPHAEAKRIVRKMKIGSIDEYRSNYRKHPELPAHPNEIYLQKGWKGWEDFLGASLKIRYNTYGTILEAKKAVSKFHFRSNIEYKDNYKIDPKLPSCPQQKYKDAGWKGWPDFLGRVSPGRF